MKKEFSVFLDMSRWLAAFFVVISHTRHIVLAEFGEVTNHPNIFIKMLYSVTGLGHEAVMVFFVLSGFLVGGITLKRWKTTSLVDYFVHRFSRIYTVLFSALVIGCLIDYLGSTFFNISEIYTNAAQYHTNAIRANIRDYISVKAFFDTLFMQGTYFGSNTPLWSLVYEWWYYCIFAACFALVLRKNMYIRLVSIISLIAFATFCSSGMLLWMVIWWLGVGTFFYCESSLPKLPVWASLILLITALVLSRINTHNIAASGLPTMSVSFFYDLAIGIGYSLLLASCYHYKSKILFSSIHKKMADFSYSLYLVHFPMMVLIVAILHDVFSVKFLGQPSSAYIVYFVLVVVILYAYGCLFAWATERHTAKIRKSISRLLEHKVMPKSLRLGSHTPQDI